MEQLDASLPHANVYTDGGCDPNPGPGGWGAIIRLDGREWVLSGNDPDTTNNRMELQAAAAALALLEGLLGPCRVDMHTDSQYLRRGITEWLPAWEARGWRLKDGSPVKNEDLWRTLYRLTWLHQLTWHWLRGHAGHPLNERADWLATEARRALTRGPGAPDAHHPDAAGRPAVEISVKASGHGGWGVVLRAGEEVRELSDREEGSTVNAMLLRGATAALRALKKPCRVVLYSDADYLVKGASSWVHGWQARGWQTKDGKPVANREDWEALLEAARPHQVSWLLARGEEAPADLERAGKLAGEVAEASCDSNRQARDTDDTDRHRLEDS
jgi:ribonuclease HI